MNLLRALILLSSYIIALHAGNILIYSPSYSKSHVLANGKIADTLAAAGHNVVLLLVEYRTVNIQVTKLAKTIKMPIIDEDFESSVDTFFAELYTYHTADFNSKLEFRKSTADLCERVLKRMDELEQFRDYNFDVGFSEQLDLCGVGIIRYLGIPNHIWISSTSMMEGVSYTLGVPTPLSYLPVVEETDLSSQMSFMERAHNMYTWIETIYIHNRGADMVTDKFREYIDPNFMHLSDIAAESSLSFVNSDEMLDVARPILHKTVYIGGLGVASEAKPLEEPFKSMMMKGTKGVILMSFGTTVPSSLMPNGIKRELFKVFMHFKEYHFILKIDDDDKTSVAMGKDVPNVDLVRWMPQADILGHPRLRLFIMHGGFYGLLESAIRGVSVLAIPFFADQFRNARNAEVKGIGLALQKYEMTFDKMKTALDRLLNDDKYAKTSRRLSAMILEKPNKPDEQLLKWTDFVIKFGRLPELDVAGAKFNTIKYFDLDVIAAFICVVLVFVCAIIAVVRWTCCRSEGPHRKRD